MNFPNIFDPASVISYIKWLLRLLSISLRMPFISFKKKFANPETAERIAGYIEDGTGTDEELGEIFDWFSDVFQFKYLVWIFDMISAFFEAPEVDFKFKLTDQEKAEKVAEAISDGALTDEEAAMFLDLLRESLRL